MTDIYKRLVNRFGKENQIDKLEEEVMELALALHQLGCPQKDKQQQMDRVYEEMADVTIMFRQVPHLFDKKKLDAVIARKLAEIEKEWLTPELDFEQTEEPVKVYSPEVHYVLEQCLPYFDEHLRPNEKATPGWLDTIDKLMRLDKLPAGSIIEVVQWARKNKFWKSNFLSMLKLRKKDRDKIMYIVVFSEQMKKEVPQRTEQERMDDDKRALNYLNDD